MPLTQYVPNYVNYNRATNYLRKVVKPYTSSRKRFSFRYTASRSRIPCSIGTHHYVRNCQPVSLYLQQNQGILKVNGSTVGIPTY